MQAFFKSVFLGYCLPFDRHDWIVTDEQTGKDTRYVIDFYKGKQGPVGAPIAIHLDVRPALDSFPSIYYRMNMYFQNLWRPKPSHQLQEKPYQPQNSTDKKYKS